MLVVSTPMVKLLDRYAGAQCGRLTYLKRCRFVAALQSAAFGVAIRVPPNLSAGVVKPAESTAVGAQREEGMSACRVVSSLASRWPPFTDRFLVTSQDGGAGEGLGVASAAAITVSVVQAAMLGHEL